MDWIVWLAIALIIIAVIIWILLRLRVKMPYEMNETILTERERSFYRILKPIADKLELQICPKVRVADIVSIKKGTKDWQKWFNKIRSKHVDFLLCDYDMNIVLLLELDDSSHDSERAKKNDEFKNRLFGDRLVRIRSLKEDVEAVLVSALKRLP
ncbi:MAG: DUF2726 domain-containing protein [Oscillospiraceae bacterium]|nr:DUF2726 domain-containing protein [Oscillospiraceae bacterium]